MAKSMLAALRAAFSAEAANLSLEAEEEDVPMGGRPDSHEEENSMRENEGKPAAGILAGITDAALAEVAADAVAAAKAEGAKAERDRLTGILGAEGVKGSASRMSAALDLAIKSPGMSAEDVTGFVTSNVAEAAGGSSKASDYEASRLSAAGLASPAPQPKAKGHSLASGDIYSARRQQGRKE